jgi:hypothetical protein
VQIKLANRQAFKQAFHCRQAWQGRSGRRAQAGRLSGMGRAGRLAGQKMQAGTSGQAGRANMSGQVRAERHSCRQGRQMRLAGQSY